MDGDWGVLSCGTHPTGKICVRKIRKKERNSTSNPTGKNRKNTRRDI